VDKLKFIFMQYCPRK